MSKTDAILLFKQAAKALQEDPRYLALDAARKANDADAELQGMITEFGQLSAAYQEASLGTEEEKAQARELQARMNTLYTQIMQNGTMQNYSAAQKEAEDMIGYIDRIISAAMNGNDPMLVPETPAAGCSGSCASCAGCH